MSSRRTVRHIVMVVETEGLTEKEHERRVTWGEKNVQDSVRSIDSAFVSMVVKDGESNLVGFFGSGSTPSEEIMEIAEDLIGDG